MDVITIEGGVPPVQPAEIRVEAMSLERLLRDEHPEGMLDADWRRLRSRLQSLSVSPGECVYYDARATPYTGGLKGTVYVIDCGASLSAMVLSGLAEASRRKCRSVELALDSFVDDMPSHVYDDDELDGQLAIIKWKCTHDVPELKHVKHLHIATTHHDLGLRYLHAILLGT